MITTTGRSNSIPKASGCRPTLLVLPPLVARELDESDGSLGALGRPFDHGTPFFIGLTGALGAAVAYLLFRGIADITSAIVIIGLALFLAIGLDPILDFLIEHGLSRGYAALIVILAIMLVAAGFAVAAVPVISHEVRHLLNNYPRYKANLAAGQGWDGRLAAKLPLTGYFKSKSATLKIPVSGGLLGAGKLLLSFGVAMVSVVALTIYFLIVLPGVKKLWLSMIPRSRRERVALLTEEGFDRVGGFMLGNP
jgi:predicted PurR-regulated permease PerM